MFVIKVIVRFDFYQGIQSYNMTTLCSQAKQFYNRCSHVLVLACIYEIK